VTPAFALYRRSRSHQDLSIEQQRAAVRAWAVDHGYVIVREFSDDASGLDTGRRREFTELMALCARPGARAAEVVLCYDVSRFSRLDPEEAAFHEYSLRRSGVRVIYTHEPGVNEAGVVGHLLKSLRRVLAHDYSAKLSQVVTRGLRAHAERGHWTGGPAPYGYCRAVRRPDGSVHAVAPGRWKARGEIVCLLVEPTEGAVVREIYQSYASRGLGLGAIADNLNRRGVPAPQAARSRERRSAWSKSTLWAVLRNPLYRGTLVYGKARYAEIGKKRGKQRRPPAEHVVVPGAVPALVTDELWQVAQAKHGTRKFGVGRPYQYPYLLSGLIVCGHCQRRFRAHKQSRGSERAYYVCGGYVASGRTVCDGLRVAQSYLEDAVCDGIQKRLERLNPEELGRRLSEALRDHDLGEPRLTGLLSRQAEVGRQIARLVDVLASGIGELPSVSARLVELERERSRLEAEVRAGQARAATATPELRDEIVSRLLDALGRFRDVLAAGEPEERKAVVRVFLAEIRVEKATRQALLRWFRLPRLPESLMLVELRGLEPLTPRLPALCSPN
jgi:DNA invertase Pin-like site-specific DNA recombinase